jgi:SAM-dependent methyltransferase
MKELLIGCGNSRIKRLVASKEKEEWENLTTLDIDPSCNPDVVWDLHYLPLPFEDETFDEIHAYEVLEHVGKQGQYAFFFNQFSDFWRILKPNGLMMGSVPRWNGQWAWGDPGHTRIITEGTLSFLSQKLYTEVGRTAVTDYRSIYKVDFEVSVEINEDFLWFILRKLDAT